MRRTFGLIALLAALGSAQACLAQQSDQQQQDRQQRDVEQGLTRSDNPAFQQNYRAAATEARRHAESARSPAEKARALKRAERLDALAAQSDR